VIRPLRARHRAIFAVLAMVVPAGYAAALLGRRAPPPPSAWPAAELPAAPAGAGAERIVMWSSHSLLTRLWRSSDATLAVRVEGWREPAPPALALYWSPSAPSGTALPDGARFVGALGAAGGAPRELALRQAPAGGWLVLFSLGHGEVQGALALEDGP
jgi:hypothetical protein